MLLVGIDADLHHVAICSPFTREDSSLIAKHSVLFN